MAFDNDTVYAIKGKLLNDWAEMFKALLPLANIESKSLEILKGDRKTSIEIKGTANLSQYREVRVQLCDEAGNTYFATILVK